MPQSNPYADYDFVIGVMASGDRFHLEELEQLLEGFPDGVDDFIGRRWIINAIDCGSRVSVEWMLSQKVDLSFRDEEGYTVVHSALERNGADKYEILKLLLEAGADVNAHGINDWTPAHMAAARDDIQALELIVQAGADLSLRTRIDEYATPLEEAKTLGKTNAVKYLEGVTSQHRKA